MSTSMYQTLSIEVSHVQIHFFTPFSFDMAEPNTLLLFGTGLVASSTQSEAFVTLTVSLKRIFAGSIPYCEVSSAKNVFWTFAQCDTNLSRHDSAGRAQLVKQ